MFISNAYAQAAGGGDLGSSLMAMWPLILMFVVLWFIIIRPQSKRQKAHKSMVENLAKGDEVLTSGGVLGRITSINESRIQLEIAPEVEIQLQRQSVAQVLPKGTLRGK